MAANKEYTCTHVQRVSKAADYNIIASVAIFGPSDDNSNHCNSQVVSGMIPKKRLREPLSLTGLRQGSYVSQRALTQLLRTLTENGTPETKSRSSLYRERKLLT